VGGLEGVRGGDEVTLQERTNVGRKDAVKEERHLEADGSGIGKQAGDRSCDDERGKERDDSRISGGLGKVQEVVVQGAQERAVEDDGKAQEPSRAGGPLRQGSAERRN